jgi:dienelactone hydrolase
MTDLDATRTVPLDHHDVALEGRLFEPEAGGPAPGVLVLPSATGIGPNELDHAARLAAHGFTALVGDMHGGGAYYAEPQDAGPGFTALLGSPDLLRERTTLWLAAMRERPEVDGDRVAAIGYCFGGLCVLELARTGADLRAVASFHGLLSTQQPAAPGTIRPRIAIWTGGADPYVPDEDVAGVRAELAAAGATWQLTEFADAAHAFTDPDAAGFARPGIAYHPVAAAVSWAGTLALLDETLS